MDEIDKILKPLRDNVADWIESELQGTSYAKQGYENLEAQVAEAKAALTAHIASVVVGELEELQSKAVKVDVPNDILEEMVMIKAVPVPVIDKRISELRGRPDGGLIADTLDDSSPKADTSQVDNQGAENE